MSALTFVQYRGFASTIRKRKGIQIREDKIKLSFFVNDFAFIENPEKCINKLLEPVKLCSSMKGSVCKN